MKNERPLVSHLPDKGEKERQDISRSFLASLQEDITFAKLQYSLATSEKEKEYWTQVLQSNYLIKEHYGK